MLQKFELRKAMLIALFSAAVLSLSACSGGDATEGTHESATTEESQSTSGQAGSSENDSGDSSGEDGDAEQQADGPASVDPADILTAEEVREELNYVWQDAEGQPIALDLEDQADIDKVEADIKEVEGYPGRFDIELCLDGPVEGCDEDYVQYATYFPVGDPGRSCEEQIEGTEWTECEPDQTGKHDVSKPRMVVHWHGQDGEKYIDPPPLYKAED